MDNKLKGFHHYKGNDLSRFEEVERKVMELILSSKIPDSRRQDSVIFELMHASGCMQIARVLAQKRELNIEISEVSSLMHDIYVIINGTYNQYISSQLAAGLDGQLE